ncbi:hypothetical protein JIQ42_05712 [Leishmania sp. Namibia]|uniref:hypothetical protein n=1 Tax=Leishmania sp. Namibia TaxID=2802991 RepID=UPI001B5E7A61|nr:hypothetical protein JIQ42_05712 [Leishmania sp. Namibia]
MPPSGKVGSSAAAAAAEVEVEIDPLVVYFTFSRIRSRFSCGRTIERTLQQFRDGKLHPRDLPLLSVLTDGAHYYSQNNRRLYAYKQLKREGLIDTIPVRLRPLPQTKRMRGKYSQETCALNATLMRGTANTDGVRDTSATREDGSDASAIEDSHNNWNTCSPSGAVEKRSLDGEESLGNSLSAPSSGAPSPPARCAAEPGFQGEVVEGEESSGAAAGAKREWKRQQLTATPSQQQQQRSNFSSCGSASRRQRRPKGAAAARPSSTRSSDSDSNGGTSVLEAELRKLGLHT